VTEEQVRKSKLWKRVVKAHSKLSDAQLKGDGAAATKAWQELSGILEGGEVEEAEDVDVPMSDARRQLHEAFPDLKG